MAGVRHRLDLFGVRVLGFVAGNVGGITRDVLLGAVPPPAIGDWRYIVISFVAGLLTFRWNRLVSRLRSPVLVFDAAGLALFAVSVAAPGGWSVATSALSAASWMLLSRDLRAGKCKSSAAWI